MMRSGTPLHNAYSRTRLEMDRTGASCFSLTKVDRETGAALSGARFMLTEMSVGTRQTSASNEMGIVSFAVQPCRSYVLREITAPPGYVIDASLYIISVDRCGQAMVNNRRETPFIIGNQRVASVFSVVYSANGGTGGYAETGLVEGSAYTVKTPEQVGISFPGMLRRGARASEVFAGWNTAPDGSGTTYQPGDVVIVRRDLTFYAQWQTASGYSVRYAPNGGSGGLTDGNIPGGTVYTIRTGTAANVSYPGRQFVGWNTMPDGTGTTYLPGNTITVTSGLTLYAQWQTIPNYSVRYAPNGGSGGLTDGNIPGGTVYTIWTETAANVSYPGYQFVGWNTMPDGTGTTYLPGNTITVTGGLTLYAQWQPASLFSVTYNANGGVGAFTSDAVPSGSLYTIENPAEIGIGRAGYTFIGWNSSPAGTGIGFAPGNEISVTEDLTLYAQWMLPALFTITYDANGADGGQVNIPLEAGALYTIGTPEEWGFEEPGATFINWNTEPDGSGTSFLPGDEIIVDSDILLYAQWESAGTFSVVYDPNGGEGGHADGDLLPGAFYTILTPAEAGISHAAFSFVGWNTESDGTGTSYPPGDMTMIEGDLLLYAQWEAVESFTVSYDANGGEGGSAVSGLLAGANYTIATPEQAEVSHPVLSFVAWNTDPLGTGIAYAPDDVITVEGNLTLYAQWEAIGIFFVIYDANNGVGEYADENIEPGSFYTVLNPEDIGISRAGYDFTGWNAAPDGSGEAFDPGDTFLIISDMLLYAQWVESGI